ncbi:MAG TPA: hypothetical protein VKE93_21965 [Candidatus Angelobacter sp.]|nr:hypothetical protein [Candidatus Angelobacter sp.]
MLHAVKKPVFWIAAMFAAAVPAFAADQEAGTVIREVPMYVSPDVTAQRVAVVTRGRDVALVMGRSNVGGNSWAHVFVKVDVGLTSEKDVSGWIESRYLVTPATPNADQVIFGEAVDSENQAEQRAGRRHAAEDAMRLYYRLYQYWPNSPLAGEALWRTADIRWQLEKAGVIQRPSIHELSPDVRTQIDDELMKEIRKKFAQTKWADLAAYDMIDNKICFDWKGEASCPEKEAEIYEKYSREHPQSPKAGEALYNAAYRQAALVDIYKSYHQQDKAERARKKALELTQEIISRFPDGDWKARAANLAYALQQNIAVYGNGASGSN